MCFYVRPRPHKKRACLQCALHHAELTLNPRQFVVCTICNASWQGAQRNLSAFSSDCDKNRDKKKRRVSPKTYAPSSFFVLLPLHLELARRVLQILCKIRQRMGRRRDFLARRRLFLSRCRDSFCFFACRTAHRVDGVHCAYDSLHSF